MPCQETMGEPAATITSSPELVNRQRPAAATAGSLPGGEPGPS